MTSREGIAALIERIEGGLDIHDSCQLALWSKGRVVSVRGPHTGDCGEDEYTAVMEGGNSEYVSEMDFPDRSLDAVIGLIDGELPGWHADAHWPRMGATCEAILSESPASRRIVTAMAPSMPLALCAVFLKAKLSTLDTEVGK